MKHFLILIFCLNFIKLFCQLTNSAKNLNLLSRQFVNKASVNQIAKFKSPIQDNQEFFKLLSTFNSNTILIGGRNALYNLSMETLENKHTIEWKAPSQTIEECYMKGKMKTECHNFIRVGINLNNKNILICGTHAFSPQCREYEYLIKKNKFVELEQYNGQALSPYDPKHNSTYVYDNVQNQIFVGTVSDISSTDSLLYKRKIILSKKTEILRTIKDDRVIEQAQFVGSFIYKEYVYFWYREKAVESLDNNYEPQIYSRVGRICVNDNGGPLPVSDRFATFLKTRLNCSIPNENVDDFNSAPFYFNELQAISNPVDDGTGDSLIFGVFHTSKAFLMSAVCSFRMSQIVSIFDHGRFKTQKTPSSLWSPYQKFFENTERPGQCVSNTRQLPDISFISKNPLMYDLIPSEEFRPHLVEGPGRPAITSITSYSKRIFSVRKQPHYIIYIGREDGTIAKIVDTSINKTSIIIENVQVFPSNNSVLALQILRDRVLIAVNRAQVVRLPFEHCSLQTSCTNCVRLSDPHCAWDVESLQCVHLKDWTKGSYIQNIFKGFSEQCLEFESNSYDDNNFLQSNLVKQNLYSITYTSTKKKENVHFLTNNDNVNDIIKDQQTAKISQNNHILTKNLSLIATAILISSIVGFMIGYRISKWRLLSRPLTGSNASSSDGVSASDDYDQFVHSSSDGTRSARFSRHDLNNTMIVPKSQNLDNNYKKASINSNIGYLMTNDATSLVFNAQNFGSNGNQFITLPMITTISNGGSNIATPLHDTRTAMLLQQNENNIGATLPRDYKVKKVYL